MTDDDSGALGGAPPRLTIGQRILTALPNLQRQTPPAAAQSDVATDDASHGPSPSQADGDGDTDEPGATDPTWTCPRQTPWRPGAPPGSAGGSWTPLFPSSASGTRPRARPADDLDT